MNLIFDTHAHYDDPQFDPDREQLLRRLPDQGVVGVVSCGCDLPSSLQNQALSRQYPWFYFAAGFHPENLEGADLEDIERLRTLLADPKCVAVGEIGLDYHWMASDKDTQTAFFRRQIQLAKEVDKPIIVHDREAHGDTLELLASLAAQRRGALLLRQQGNGKGDHQTGHVHRPERCGHL